MPSLDHIVTLRPSAVPAHAIQARLDARALGFVLPDACLHGASDLATWEPFLQLRRRVLRRGGVALDVFNKTLQKPLPEKATFFAGLVEGDFTDQAQREQEFQFSYASRRFEVDDMTGTVQTCGICSFTAPLRGVFSCKSRGGYFRDPHSARKFVFRKRDVSSPCQYSYCFVARSAAHRDWIEVESVCRHCFNDLDGSGAGSRQPSFSVPAGFSHGVDVPSVLKGLSFAEEALITLFQPAMAATTIKGGQRSLTGHVTFFDRTNEVGELADLLPRLAREVDVIELEREVGASGGRMREFRVRRQRVEAALRWLIRNSPAYRNVTLSEENLTVLPDDGQLDVGVEWWIGRIAKLFKGKGQ